ncbi:MAG: glycosyltransferase family 2 protein [Actinomycetota bacterium]
MTLEPPGAPRLSVVVVNYNAGDHLIRCVRSVYDAAGGEDVDVLVVDNASRDGSADHLEAALPVVRLIRNPVNRGFAAAANQGIQATATPYVFLLNPDAEMLAGTMAGLVKVGEEHPRAGAIGVLVRDPDGSVYPSARRAPGLVVGLGHAFAGLFSRDNRFTRAYTMADWDRTTERRVDWVSGSAMLVRRRALDEVRGLDAGYFMYVEDLDLCTRLVRAGWKVVFSPEVEVVHVGGVSTGRSRRMFYEHGRSAYRYFVKFRSPGPLAALRPAARVAFWVRAWLAARRLGRP